MPETKTCPKCGGDLPANAPAGICPACLMQAGLASEPSEGANPELKPTTTASAFAPPDPEELAKHFSQLELLELVGSGGMGAVYKARQRGLDRMVAVKILPPKLSRDPAFAERFTREARALALLSHSHIVSVYDFGQADDLFFIVMEYVDGVNLRQAMQSGGLTPRDALAIVPQICAALQYAHDEGIVHRDIKPENILIDKKGRVKIADFGLAKLLGRESTDHSLTGTHQVMGTVRYMAPEQMEASRAVDHRADIYSLGVVFYEMLTGELPLGRFAPPSEKVQVDVRLDEVVLRSLAKEPERRYQQASEVKTDVEEITRSRASVSESSKPRPATPTHTGEPVDRLRELANFWMSPQPGFGKCVGWPMIVLLFIWCTATATVHAVFGQKDNYREGPILLVQGGGMMVLAFAFFMLMVSWAAHRRANRIPGQQPAERIAPSEPHFSGAAIIGAVWAFFGLLAALPILYFVALNRVWNGTALPTDVIHTEPPLYISLFMGVLLVIGAGAPIGTTIIGAIAITHIKRSCGRIYGLPLAAADAILFPLILLFFAFAGGLGLALAVLFPFESQPPDYEGPERFGLTPLRGVILGAFVALPVSFLVGRALWRAISTSVALSAPEVSKQHPEPDPLAPATEVRPRQS